MYNIYKHQEDARMKQTERLQDQTFTKWLLRHQQLKNKSSENMKKRVGQFVKNQSLNPSVIEDDHYKTWRYMKQYRDIQDSNKFIGFKSFRHRPNYDVGKHYDQRQRKQMSYLAEKSKQLVQNQLIPEQHRSRSLRSQGPLAPKHTFRQKKPDNQLLQPRMRYTNITDKQRFIQTSVTFDDKFHKIYNTFSFNKSKIGNPVHSPVKTKQKFNQIDMMSSTFSEHNKKHNKQRFFYSVDNQQENKDLTLSKYQNNNTSKFNHLTSRSQSKEKKIYFKTAKTFALNGDRMAKDLMIQTQYDRKKDLTNISRNLTNQSFIKRPIL